MAREGEGPAVPSAAEVPSTPFSHTWPSKPLKGWLQRVRWHGNLVWLLLLGPPPLELPPPGSSPAPGLQACPGRHSVLPLGLLLLSDGRCGQASGVGVAGISAGL